MIRFMVVTHEMEERFILKKNVSSMDTKESFLFRIFIEFQVLKSCDDGPVYFFFFFFLQLKYCPTSFVITLVLGFISLCYLKRIILIDKMNVDVFVAFKSYGSEWVK